MFEDKIKELDALIAECDDVDFATKKNWGRQDLIEQAEKDLGFKLPESYKWWVNNYKFGSIGFDQEIFSLYETVAGVVSASNIVTNHLHPKKHEILPAALPESAFVFFKPFEGEEIYFFDVSPDNDEYEVFVYLRSDRYIESYADSFIDFMIQFIKLNYNNDYPTVLA